MSASGEVIKKDFLLIQQAITTPGTVDYSDEEASPRCCFELLVTASATESKNDITSVYFGFPLVVTGATMTLYKGDVLKATFSDDTYGEFFAFGFQDDGIKKYIGYQLNWKLIYDAFGEGDYYVKCTPAVIVGAATAQYSFTYCLRNWNASLVEGTIKLETYHNGVIGDYSNDVDRKSFKDLDWYNSIRLKGIVYGEKSEFQAEEIQYSTGRKIDATLEQNPIYELQLEPIPNEVHRYLKIEALLADDLYVTDYNVNNPIKPIVQKAVLFTGNYEPSWKGMNKYAYVTIQLEQKINNLRKTFA